MDNIDLMFLEAHCDDDMEAMLEKYDIDEDNNVADQMKDLIRGEGGNIEDAHDDFYDNNQGAAPSGPDIEWFWIAWYMCYKRIWSGTEWV